MTPFEVYVDYLALRNHFNQSNYDYHKYNGKVSSGNRNSFEKRKDQLFFQKLAKHSDPHNLMLANFVSNPKSWVRDLAYSPEAERVYLEWAKRQQALSYTVRRDLDKLDEVFNDNFVVKPNEHPPLLRLYSSSTITPETLCVLVDLTGCYGYWQQNLKDDPLWKSAGLFIRKYTPFLKYDKGKIKKEVLTAFGA